MTATRKATMPTTKTPTARGRKAAVISLTGRYRAKAALEPALEGRGHTRTSIAAALDVTYPAVRYWLTGERSVAPDVATRIAKLAGSTRSAMFVDATDALE